MVVKFSHICWDDRFVYAVALESGRFRNVLVSRDSETIGVDGGDVDEEVFMACRWLKEKVNTGSICLEGNFEVAFRS